MFATRSFARAATGVATAALFAGACLFSAVAPAAAGTPTYHTVRHADLNLATPEGRAVLAARLKAATRAVCDFGGSDLVSKVSATRCARTAVHASTVA